MRGFNAAIFWILLSVSFLSNAETFKSGENQVTLVELYSSEGCSSCPPAERWLGTLSRHPRLWQDFVPVAFHVDYWNYLGWKDPFASAEFSQRQRTYRRQRGVASVYTPGFVANGSEWRGWFQRQRDIPNSLSTPGELTFQLDELAFSADFAANGEYDADLTLNIAILAMDVTTKVKRGENGGRTLNHNFIVTHYEQVRSADGLTWEGVLPVPELPLASVGTQPSYALAAWLTEGQAQRPIQAVGGYLDPTQYLANGHQ